MDVLEYGIKLVDQFSPAATGASKATQQLTTALDKSRAMLAEQEKGLGKAKTQLAAYGVQLRLANQLGDVEGYKKYAALLGDQQRKVFDLGNFMQAHRPIAQGYIDGLEKQAGAAAKADVANAAFGEALEGLAGPAGIAIGVITTVAATFAGLTIEGAKLAIEAVELRQELETTFDALGDGPGAGKATLDMLGELEGPLAQTRGQLAEWTKTYEALGITDLSGIRYQLQATASAQAIMGASGAAAYENITKKVQEAIETHHGLKIADKGLAALGATGANVADVAAKLGITSAELRNQLKKGTVDAQTFGDALSAAIIEKGQGPLDNLRGDVGTISAHAHESFMKLFEGVDPKPFTDSLQSIVSILDSSQPSAQAASWGIKSFLDEVFKIGGEALPIVKHFFLDMEIAALRTYIVLKPLIRDWQAIGGTDVGLKIVAQDFSLLAKFIEIAAVNTAYFVRLLGSVVKLGAQASSFGLLGQSAGAGFAGGVKASKAGHGAGEDMAEGTIKGLTKKLEIQSPSRVMFRAGVNTGMGFAGGMRSEQPRVASDAASLGVVAVRATAYAAAPSSGNAGGRSSGQGPTSTVTVMPGAIQINGGSAQSMLDLTETAVAALFERYALQRGVAA